jgi:hypothetical protein
MYPTLIFGVLMLAANIRYAIKPERRLVPLQISLGLMTLFGGMLGFTMGTIRSFMAMGEVGADKKWIWLLGVGESLNNVALALVMLVLGCIAASIGAVRIARAPEPTPAPSPT